MAVAPFVFYGDSSFVFNGSSFMFDDLLQMTHNDRISAVITAAHNHDLVGK
jgi:hypothetical protein